MASTFNSGSHDGSHNDEDVDITLDSIVRTKTINFPIRANYTKWPAREAFRELVQNWRDGIIASFKLQEHQFRVIRESRRFGPNNSSEEIVYKVPNPTCGTKLNCLGYVLFTGHNGFGQIEITNREATLEPRHLDLGHTTKTKGKNQAGAHGEGLKLAALVFLRCPQNHAVFCRSGGFNWKFNFSKRGRLVTVLARMSQAETRKALEDREKQISEGSLLPFVASPQTDVQFFIGGECPRPYQGRNGDGHDISRKKVERADFDAWITCALFLHAAGDNGIISTPHGDLLTSPGLVGRLYLKGLLLSETTPTRSASITTLHLKFGYNFANGETNRERQSIVGSRAEGLAIMAIWRGVLAERPAMVKDLSDMLNSDETKYADIHDAKNILKRDEPTARFLRDYLVGDDRNGNWYYSKEQLSQNPRLEDTIRGLGREKALLTDTYWTILYGHGLLRTAAEKEKDRFVASQTASIPATSFAASISRLLKNCIRLCQKTADISLTFVQAGQLQLPLHYSPENGTLLVHERWLDAATAVDYLGLPESLTEADQVFHAVEKLFTDALAQLPDEVFLGEGHGRTANWRRNQEVCLARQHLLSHFRTKISVSASGSPAESLRIQWKFDTCWDADAPVIVQCHRMSECSHLRQKLLDNDWDLPTVPPCTETGQLCRSWQGKAGDETHMEDGLQVGAEYFFVILLLRESGLLPYVSESKIISPAPLITSVSPATTARTARPSPFRNMGFLRHGASLPSGSISTFNMHQDTTPSPRRTSAIIIDDDNDDSNSDNDAIADSSNPSGQTYFASRSITNGTSLTPQPRTSAASQIIRTPSNTTNGSPSTQRSHASEAPSFVLGARLHSFDIFKTDQEKCYDSKGPDGRQAIIAMIKDGTSPASVARKRPRTNDNVLATDRCPFNFSSSLGFWYMSTRT
ncbi:hypothetical protein LIA77_06055 [Sarocladium implicatum]|nr:hypothetical protein LIA77_06055 [Sarocladium implicatum]